MKIVCNGLELSDAVLKVSKALGSKTTNPILEGIKLEAKDDTLTLSATDMELYIEKQIRAEVKIEGSTVVPGKFFCEFIKKLSGEQIELNLNEKNVITIGYTDSVATIQCLPTDEFPTMKELSKTHYFDINSKSLRELIEKTIFSVATDDNRPVLKGALFEIEGNNITSVAVDGFRIALLKRTVLNSSGDMSAIIPARSLNEISKLLEDDDDTITVYVEPNYLMLKIDDTSIITRLLNGQFIEYKQVLEKSGQASTVVTINKEQLNNTLDRAGLLSRIERNNLVRFDVTDKVMQVSAKSDLGEFKENITIALEGNDVSLDFNARYFTEALRVIDCEFLKLNFNGIAPCTITGVEDTDFTYLIIPLRRL